MKAHAHLQPQLEFEMALWLMKKPVVAAVQGHVLGGGWGPTSSLRGG